MCGVVDFGVLGAPDGKSGPATDVLVFMVVPLAGSWKLPIAFFFVAGLNASGKYAFLSI